MDRTNCMKASVHGVCLETVSVTHAQTVKAFKCFFFSFKTPPLDTSWIDQSSCSGLHMRLGLQASMVHFYLFLH